MEGGSTCILLVSRSLFVAGRYIMVRWGFLQAKFFFLSFFFCWLHIASGVVYGFSVTIS